MHPRQMKRAPLGNFRNFVAAPSPTLVNLATVPSCAFAAVGAPHALIEVVRGFSVHLPFVGNLVLAYPVGTVVEAECVEAWGASDAMAIVARRPPYTHHGLFAVPRRSMRPSDILLGGFDLSHSGAVLASSFWDANLEDHDGAINDAGTPTAQRIAEIFIERARDGFADTTATDLVREGISERDAMQHYEAGAAIAAGQLRDTELSADRIAYSRQVRVMVGANAVAGLLLTDAGAINTACRLAGLHTAEVGSLYDDIIGEAMRLVREARAIPAGVR
jgi:hypothetical protein